MCKLSLKSLFLAGLFCATPLVSIAVSAKGVFQSGPDFINRVFESQQAQAKTLWITADISRQAKVIMGRPESRLRVHYHQSQDKTAWILQEIGKEMPITIGVVIEDNKIAEVKILAYRESRGGEVRHPAYTRQYRGASLTEDHKLDQTINGITGATLSVRAVNKVAALALYYHHQALSKATD